MITHIVAWKLAAEDPEGRAAAVAAIAGALESLVGVIDELVDLKVSANVVAIEGNLDAGLIAHFETEADLRAYLVHPEHVKAVQVVRQNTTGRAAIDFEA